ncbi:MAG: hypothetical protein HOH74_10745, partial [Gemmatimonadetes bacterium]|nr:hypothetical protein [Gemmatimonadota bacterium]
KKVDEAQQDLRDRLMDGLSGRDHLDAGEGEEPEERQSDLVQSRRQVDTERLEILSVIEELESVFQQTEDLFRDIATGKPADKASWQQCIDAQELRVMEENLGAIKAYASTPDLHDVDLVDRLIAAQLGAYIAHLRAVTLDSTTPGWDTAILSPPV